MQGLTERSERLSSMLVDADEVLRPIVGGQAVAVVVVGVNGLRCLSAKVENTASCGRSIKGKADVGLDPMSTQNFGQLASPWEKA
ncbi:hypothetical protein CYMTET_20000 [Cymbomonas tetramitiformis]|uniref:Uncharacterized protein n=1 Tax=Cymbomonas tetramitiformis TaxID=36881 RepID=A0AAE0L4B5_9CHLO|nr:hypothetical protein CYMTET_20000 [Cymbomonas tetramitiformis]